MTQEQYERVMGANPSNFKGPQHPVEMVTWDDAFSSAESRGAAGGAAAIERIACRPRPSGSTLAGPEAGPQFHVR